MGATASSGTSTELETVQQGRYAFADPGLALEPPVISTRPEDVAEVWTETDYRLGVRFFDGTSGMIEMRELILGKSAGIFATLADVEEFSKVGIGYGTVMWANGVDLAPDPMYDALKKTSVWELR